jgi:hypothetical protein
VRSRMMIDRAIAQERGEASPAEQTEEPAEAAA